MLAERFCLKRTQDNTQALRCFTHPTEFHETVFSTRPGCPDIWRPGAIDAWCRSVEGNAKLTSTSLNAQLANQKVRKGLQPPLRPLVRGLIRLAG
jgi:hypothetical protein